MRKVKTGRGFNKVVFKDSYGMPCYIQQSSAIDETTESGFENPGSSYVWLGVDQLQVDRELHLPYKSSIMHLSRKNVEDLIVELQEWLDKGDFKN